jgi:predicted outer membrane repeat protein
MHRNLLRTAAKTAAVGGVAALGLGALQAAALAAPSTVTRVPCNPTALATAITDATAGATISLASGCVYNLPAALPTITTQLTITGHNAALQRSYATATPSFIILTVSTKGNLTTNNVNFYNGGGDTLDQTGGAIYNDGGTLTVNGGTFRGDDTPLGLGGGIYNEGGMQVTGATFTNDISGYGGAIYNAYQANLLNTSFDHNSSTDSYGGAVYNDDNLVVNHCLFASNTTGEYGGAIYDDDLLTVNDSAFQNNYTEYGGAIYSDESTVVNDSALTGNQAIEGGAIYDEDSLSVSRSSIARNIAQYGAGLYNADAMSVEHTDVNYNQASTQGGGVYNDDGALNIGYSTIDYNSAPSGGGGILNAVLLSGPRIGAGRSPSFDLPTSGTVSLTKTSVHSNKPDNCEPLDTIVGCTS